jgi:hypothetical protein
MGSRHYTNNSVADSDPACDFDADPDPHPTSHFKACLVPDPSFQIKAQNLEKVLEIGSYGSIHFGLPSANGCGSGSTILTDN